MKSFFPDVNVWIALAYEGHQHHASASAWFSGLIREVVYFCRFTQLGLLRLLTNPSILGEDVRSQTEAWRTYDAFFQDERVSFHNEADPDQVEFGLRKLTSAGRPASRQYPDAYLVAFARAAGLTVVTLDRGLSRMADGNALLLS